MNTSKIKNFTKTILLFALLGSGMSLAPAHTYAQVGAPEPTTTAGQTTTTAPSPKCSDINVKCASCAGNPTANDCVPVGGDSAAKCGPDSCDLIAKYINPLITLLSAVVGVVAVISIIYGAIQYSSSAGDPQKAAKARGHITNTVLALVAYIFLFAFIQFLIPGGILKK